MKKAMKILIAVFCMLYLYSPHCRADMTEWKYKLITEDQYEVKCTQVMHGECITHAYRHKDDNQYRILSGTVDPVPETPEDPVDPPFEGFVQRDDGLFKIPVIGCNKIVPSTTHAWEPIDNGVPDVPKVWLQALPEAPDNTNLGKEISDAPMIGCNVKVIDGGDFYVWMRGGGPDPSSDSINFGGKILDSPDPGLRHGTLSFNNRPWSNYDQYRQGKAGINLPTGEYEFQTWMREDSVKLLGIVLTKDPDYVPTDESFVIDNTP